MQGKKCNLYTSKTPHNAELLGRNEAEILE